jgi:hypothetical protein
MSPSNAASHSQLFHIFPSMTEEMGTGKITNVPVLGFFAFSDISRVAIGRLSMIFQQVGPDPVNAAIAP